MWFIWSTASRYWPLPFVILIALIVARQWRSAGAYAAAALIAIPLPVDQQHRIAAPRWHFEVSDRLSTLPAQLLDDPRWIAMLAAVLTVSGPWAAGALATLVVDAAARLRADPSGDQRHRAGPLRWWVWRLGVRRSVGCPDRRHPALEVPLDGAVRCDGPNADSS